MYVCMSLLARWSLVRRFWDTVNTHVTRVLYTVRRKCFSLQQMHPTAPSGSLSRRHLVPNAPVSAAASTHTHTHTHTHWACRPVHHWHCDIDYVWRHTSDAQHDCPLVTGAKIITRLCIKGTRTGNFQVQSNFYDVLYVQDRPLADVSRLSLSTTAISPAVARRPRIQCSDQLRWPEHGP